MTIIEHKPWQGLHFHTAGIDGQRIGIVGHSHYDKKGGCIDTDAFTENCMGKVMSGKWHFQFFTSIRNYFGFDDHEDFWDRVLFFNYIPSKVASAYDYGTPEQIAHAEKRFTRLIRQHKPHKVLFFTNKNKIWQTLPQVRSKKQEIKMVISH